MRICVVQTVLPLYSISFFNHIVDFNSEIDLIVMTDLTSKDSLNQFTPKLCKFKTIQLNNFSLFGIFFRPNIISKLCNIKADVVVFSASPREWGQLAAMIYARFMYGKIVTWGMFHRIGKPRLFTKIYFKLLGSLSDRCFTYSRVGATQLINLGIKKSKIRVIGTAIDEKIPLLQTSSISEKELIDFKKDNQINGKKIILQVVRLTRTKKPEILIHALKIILGHRDDVELVLIGAGEMELELRELVSKLGLINNVKFLGAIYDEAKLCPWYLSSHVFVIPSFLGLSGHHAMSYGLPVVTDDSLDNQGSEFEIIYEGLNALIYKEGNVVDLARVLLRLLSDDTLQKFLGENALKTIQLHHNLERKVNNFIENISQLTGS